MSNTNTLESKSPVTDADAEVATGDDLNPVDDFVAYVSEYARRRPDQAALWCFGVGFIVGWKLKPW